VDDDIQCKFDATRRVLVASGDPPNPDQAGFAGTVYIAVAVQTGRTARIREEPMMPKPMTEEALRHHVRQIHYLLQWFVAIAVLQLAVLGYLTYKLVQGPVA
jgi:hypothetical protein